MKGRQDLHGLLRLWAAVSVVLDQNLFHAIQFKGGGVLVAFPQAIRPYARHYALHLD